MNNTKMNDIAEMFQLGRRNKIANNVAGYCGVYVAYLIGKNSASNAFASTEKLSAFIEKFVIPVDLKDYLLSVVSDGFCDFVKDLSLKFSPADLKTFIMSYELDKEFSTPKSLTNLAIEILDVRSGETVADFCSGEGGFLSEVAVKRVPGSLYGIDIDQSSNVVAMLRMDILESQAEIVNGDVLVQLPERKFDKVFSNYPFGQGVRRKDKNSVYSEIGGEGIPDFASMDWLYNKVAYDSLKSGGVALVVSTVGSVFNGRDEKIRQYFLDNSMIKAVVSLPEKLFAGTAIATVLLVLGENHGGIRMVDATAIYTPGRRVNVLSDENIQDIVKLLDTDSNNSKVVSREEISANGYSLLPKTYLTEQVALVNPVGIGSLALEINRGVLLKAQELDEMASDDAETMAYYLRLSDIEDGACSDDLFGISDLDVKSEKCLVKSGDLLISKTGAPYTFKVAVADFFDEKKIYANGNLYVVRLDEKVVYPYYVAAFLNSGLGEKVLEKVAVGTTLKSLPIKALREIPIPLPSMEKQREIGDRYRQAVMRVKELKAQLAVARENLRTSYGEV